MTSINDYVTETEAARMVGVSAGKGYVWRHLREYAPHIKLEKLFGYTAVKRSALQAYLDNRRAVQLRRRKLATIRRVHRKVLGNGRSPAKYTRRRCPVCGQWVSNRGLGWQWHLDSHRLGERLDTGREIVRDLAEELDR